MGGEVDGLIEISAFDLDKFEVLSMCFMLAVFS